MNNRRLLIATEFHFVHSAEKDGYHKLTQNSVSFSCQSKQVSRCCINFPRELTCQILTNQRIKVGRDQGVTMVRKGLSPPPVFLNNWLNFCVRGQFKIKILKVRGHQAIVT